MRCCFQGDFCSNSTTPFIVLTGHVGPRVLYVDLGYFFPRCIILQLQTLNFVLKLTDSILWDHPPLFAINFSCVYLHFSNLSNLVSSSECIISPLTLCFQTPWETCAPATERGNPANGVCQPAKGEWVVKEERERLCCRFPALGKKVPPAGMRHWAACLAQRLLPHSHPSRRHRWWTAKSYLLSNPGFSA